MVLPIIFFRYSDLFPIQAYQQQLTLTRSLDDPIAEATALMGSAVTEFAQDKAREAIMVLERALELSSQAGSLLLKSRVAWELGLAYEKIGDINRAIHFMDDHIAYTRSIDYFDGEDRATGVELLRKHISASQK